jgi:hypothetical protein
MFLAGAGIPVVDVEWLGNSPRFYVEDSDAVRDAIRRYNDLSTGINDQIDEARRRRRTTGGAR